MKRRLCFFAIALLIAARASGGPDQPRPTRRLYRRDVAELDQMGNRQRGQSSASASRSPV